MLFAMHAISFGARPTTGDIPPAFVESSKNSGTNTNSIVVTHSVPTVGNLIWIGVFAVDGNAGDINTPSGFSIGNAEVDVKASQDIMVETFYRVADGTEGTSTTISLASEREADGFVVHYLRFSGLATPTLDKVATTTRNNTTENTISSGTTATTTANDEVVIAFGGLENDGITESSLTNSFIEAQLTDLDPIGSDGDASVVSAYKIVSSTGTQETTITFTGAPNDSAVGMIATFKNA